jgi:hypothetical protein
MVWEKDRWDHRDHAYYVSEGHWRWNDEPTPTTVYEPPVQEEEPIEYAPPRNIAERRTPPPFRGAVWIAGYWGWDGEHHNWVSGRWSARHAKSVWTPDRWQRQPGHGKGEKARWVHVAGHWDH